MLLRKSDSLYIPHTSRFIYNHYHWVRTHIPLENLATPVIRAGKSQSASHQSPTIGCNTAAVKLSDNKIAEY